MKLGYARVSTTDQSLDLQIDALKAAGCGTIYSEKLSGASTESRTALADCLAQPDDVCPVSQKDKIAEALILDNDLRAKRIVTDDRIAAVH